MGFDAVARDHGCTKRQLSLGHLSVVQKASRVMFHGIAIIIIMGITIIFPIISVSVPC